MYDVLKGLRVVEAWSFVASPICGEHPLELGAEVIRFDAIGGGGSWTPIAGRSMPRATAFSGKDPTRARSRSPTTCPGGRARGQRLTDRSVAAIVKLYAARIGQQSDEFSGHSLRMGFVTTAADRDVSETRIMDVTRHKDTRTVRTYIRRANAFKGHAGASFL